MSAALPVPATCDGCPCPEPSTTPIPGASGSSVTVEVEPPGINCPNGGIKVTSLSGVTYVCNGENGAASTVTVEIEPPGANCEFGGIKITSDSGTEYVCNGGCSTPCTDGSDGVSSFTVTTADYTQPIVGNTVNVEVVDSSWVAVGEPMFVTAGGSYLVTATPDPTHVTLQNLGYAGNAAPAANVTAGKIVTPSGLKGDTGAAGSSATPVEVYDTNAIVAATQDITLVKPAGKSWSNFEISYIGSFDDNGSVGPVSVAFTWQTAPLIGTALTPGAAVGCGNGGQQFTTNNSDDSITPTWIFKGTVPALLLAANAITIRATITLSGVTQSSGVFAGKGSYIT
jgi:hypothetical protein